MRYIFALFLILSALSCRGQIVELGYSSGSIKGWGNLPKTTKFNGSLLISATHSSVVNYVPGVRYSRIYSQERLLRDQYGKHVNGIFNMFFVMPASFNFSAGRFFFLERIGLGFSDKPFPNEDGKNLNFLLEGGVGIHTMPVLSLSIRYSHISNGFRGQINPGLDNIVFAIALHIR